MYTEGSSQIRVFGWHTPSRFFFRFCLVLLFVICFCAHLSGQDPATMGQWAPVFSTTYEPIHVVVLPNGKILLWSIQGESLYPQLWDPATGTTTPTPLP